MTMQFSWWTFLIQGVNFLVLVWLLQRFLYRPVAEVIARRREETEAAKRKAAAAAKDAETARVRYDEALADIEKERSKALESARATIEAERKRMRQDACEAEHVRMARAEKAIADKASEARDALKVDTVDLALELARKILSGIAPSIPTETLLQRLEQEFANLSEEERRGIVEQLSANGSRIELVTAEPLSEQDKCVWTAHLEKIMARPLEIDFASDPELIAGSVVHLPHMTLKAAWQDQLAAARSVLLPKERS